MADGAQNIDLNNDEFQNIWKLIKHTNQSVFMTGRAGTGKSTFLKYICANTAKKYAVMAPTGIAAVNAGGVTMHSFFKIPFKPILPDDPEFAVDKLRKRMKYRHEHAKLIQELELIIIDEISMVRADLIDFIDKILRVYSRNMRVPFGGKQMLFVGDIFQLEPVVTSDMRDILRQYYPNPYFFSANVFRSFDIVPIELRKVYRQQDNEFVALLDRFRIGSPYPSDVARLNRLVSHADSKADDEFTMTLATRRDMVDSINDAHLAELKAPAVTYEGIIKADFPESSLPTSKNLVLKTGAQVVMVRNDRDHRWVNGTVAKVYSASTDKLEIELETGERHVVEPEIWENVVYKYDEESKKVLEEVIGTFTQYPVRLAWALTIHKSQGLTFNKVIIDVGRGAFSGGQTYVALSRCRALDGITLRSTINERDIFVNPAIVDFSRRFNNQILVNEALARAEADDAYENAARAFDDLDMDKAVDCFIKAIKARDELKNPLAVRLIKQKLFRLAGADKTIESLKAQIEDDRKKFSELADEYVMMGNECADEIGDLTSALANFNKALKICPEHTEAAIAKSRALVLAGESAEAITALRKVIADHPAKIDAMLILSEAYSAENDMHNALDIALKALETDSEEARTHTVLANIYDNIGDEAQAAYHRKLAAKYGKRSLL